MTQTATTRVERRRDRRKAEIVRTATEILSSRGYQGMSLEDVAEQTDIAKATLYHYFSGKDELVAAVLEALTVDVISRLEAQRDAVRDQSYLVQLRALIREEVRILTDTAPEVATVFSWPCTACSTSPRCGSARGWPRTRGPSSARRWSTPPYGCSPRITDRRSQGEPR